MIARISGVLASQRGRAAFFNGLQVHVSTLDATCFRAPEPPAHSASRWGQGKQRTPQPKLAGQSDPTPAKRERGATHLLLVHIVTTIH